VRNGKVDVRAPLRTPKGDIDSFVASKNQWILDTLANQHIQIEKKETFVIDYGSNITLQGKQYIITKKSGARAGFDGTVFYMPPGLTPEHIKTTCVQIYKLVAKSHISNRVAYFSAQMGVAPSVIKINSAKKRWGSCSSSKSLNFSWRLIMAEDSVIDYVVVHELAHLAEMNHSSRFWAVVARVLPDYKERKKQLKSLQMKLVAENWD